MTIQQQTGDGSRGYSMTRPTETTLAPERRVAPERPMEPERGERAMGDIVSELVENTQILVRNEIALGITQLERKTEEAKTKVARTAASGVAGYTGFVVLVVAAVAALNLALALWLSALIVGAVLVGAAYLVLPHGGKKNQEQPRRPGGLQRTSPPQEARS
jgi:hypothetical protein